MSRIAYLVSTWNGARLQETLSTMPPGARVEVINNKERGWALSKSWNYGLEMLFDEGYDAVVVCNDDIRLKADTGHLLAHGLLHAQFEEVPHAEGEDCTNNSCPCKLAEYRGRMILVTGYNTKHIEDRGAMWGVGAADYSCFCVSPDYLHVVGKFDEDFQIYHEDNDSHRRIRLAGYEAGCFAPYFHYGSSTVETDPVRRAEVQHDGGLFQQSRALYVQKWGGEPHRETYLTPYNR